MGYENKRVNRLMLIGWTAINIILVLSYMLEVVKGTRTIDYVFVFALIASLPEIVALAVYKNNNHSSALKYVIVVGYMVMYTFVMITGNTFMVFSYIFPMLSFLILYHRKNLILWMGITVLVMNLVFIWIWTHYGGIGGRITTIKNSCDHEIQIALIVLCFGGCYAATRLYDSISVKNNEYARRINENSRQMQQMTLQSIMTIANTIDAKDEYTKGHSQRVADYSYTLAKAMGVSDDDAENIRFIGLLHDIGKIGVPDTILNKAGRLTDDEYEIMKTHPTVGAMILKDIELLPGLDIGAKYHHERYDGRGYPSGLKGDEIPFVAKIIGVADSYDAMSSDRVYRSRLSDEEILEEFERCKGTQFDPKIADAFIQLLKENKIKAGA